MFVCVHNAGRPQMAAGFMTALSEGQVDVRSAGSAPADQINPVAVEAMHEVGIDITANQPKILTPDAVEASDVVVTMGCGDACPFFPGVRKSTRLNSSHVAISYAVFCLKKKNYVISKAPLTNP